MRLRELCICLLFDYTFLYFLYISIFPMHDLWKCFCKNDCNAVEMYFVCFLITFFTVNIIKSQSLNLIFFQCTMINGLLSMQEWGKGVGNVLKQVNHMSSNEHEPSMTQKQ